MLAVLLHDHGDELLADFQQYYGVDLAMMVERCELERAHTLATQLPPASRLARAMDPRAAWSQSEYLLANIADQIAFLRYERSGGKGGKPKQIPRPKAPKKARREKTVHGYSKADVMAALSAPRR